MGRPEKDARRVMKTMKTTTQSTQSHPAPSAGGAPRPVAGRSAHVLQREDHDAFWNKECDAHPERLSCRDYEA
jgi:hypothetical protein